MSTEKTEKAFWYALTFSGKNDRFESESACVYMAYPSPHVTMARIATAKERVSRLESVVLQSASFLGVMTMEEFESGYKPPVPPPAKETADGTTLH